MTAQQESREQAQAPVMRLPVRLKSGGPWTPESPSVALTDTGLLDLESRWHSLQGVTRGIRENMRAVEQGVANPILEERLAEKEGEIRKIEVRIAEAPAETLLGVAVKLRLLDFPRDPEFRVESQNEICTHTALDAVERLLIADNHGTTTPWRRVQ